MASLASIANKLDELVKQKAAAEPKEPTQEEKDEERMREIEAKIADLVELMSSGTTRESADHSVSDAKDRVQTTQGEERPFLRVYHDHGGKRIPTTRRTQVCGRGGRALFRLLTRGSLRRASCSSRTRSSSGYGSGSTRRTWSTGCTSSCASRSRSWSGSWAARARSRRRARSRAGGEWCILSRFARGA